MGIKIKENLLVHFTKRKMHFIINLFNHNIKNEFNK